MKKLLLFLLCTLMLAGCNNPNQELNTPTQATSPVYSEPEVTESYMIYLPLESADGLESKVLNVAEITPESVLDELKGHNVLPENVMINLLEVKGTELNLDFNQAFADLVCSTGTAGEMMIIGSVVNTYLSAYQSSNVECVLITVEGSTWESGHVIYDEPIGPME